MQTHTKNYLRFFNIGEQDKPMCEYCKSHQINDIHHITPRSKFGSKRKAEQDHISNLIGLCRECHNKAHSHEISKEQLFEIIAKR